MKKWEEFLVRKEYEHVDAAGNVDDFFTLVDVVNVTDLDSCHDLVNANALVNLYDCAMNAVASGHQTGSSHV